MARCEDCAFCRDVTVYQQADGPKHCTAICVCDVYQAKSIEDVMKAELYVIGWDVDEEKGCTDFVDYRG